MIPYMVNIVKLVHSTVQFIKRPHLNAWKYSWILIRGHRGIFY